MRFLLQSVIGCAAVGCAFFAAATLLPAPTVTAGSSAKARGAELFATRGCAHCHGTAGVGGSEGPDLQLVRKRMKNAQVFRQIHDGGKSMPPYSDILSSAQIDDLVAYLRAKRKMIVVAPKPTATTNPNGTQPDPE